MAKKQIAKMRAAAPKTKKTVTPQLRNGNTCYLLPMKDGIPEEWRTNPIEFLEIETSEVVYPSVKMINVEKRRGPCVVNIIDPGSFHLYYSKGEPLSVSHAELLKYATPSQMLGETDD